MQNNHLKRKKILFGLLLVLLIGAVSIAGIVYYLDNRTIAYFPDPEVFFGESYEVEVSTQGEYIIEYEIYSDTPDLRQASFAFSRLVTENFPFELQEGDKDEDGTVFHGYIYNGDKAFVDKDISRVWLSFDGNQYEDADGRYRTTIYLFEQEQFPRSGTAVYQRLNPENPIDGEEPDIEFVQIPDINHFFGVSTSGSYENRHAWFNNSPGIAIPKYMSLLEDCGMKVSSAHEDDVFHWRLTHHTDKDADMDIYMERLDSINNGGWFVSFVVSPYLYEVEGEVWRWPEGQSPTDSSAESKTESKTESESKPASEPKAESKSESTTVDWCSACGGDGNCNTCGGDGYVQRLMAGTTNWVSQHCTSCIGGNCWQCGGSGKN